MKVIFDTNLYISTLIKPSGAAAKAYTLWSKDKRFSLLTSETQLDEFRRVSRYPELKALISSQRAGAMVNKLRLRATLLSKIEADRTPVYCETVLSTAKGRNRG